MLSESEQVSNAMDPEVKMIWVEALRSGEYRQGKTSLKKVSDTGRESFCCLGVLCDLAVMAGVIPEGTEKDGETNYAGYTGVLPVEVRKWAGVEMEGRFGPNHTERLIYLNDEAGFGFYAIADVIEAKL